MLNKMWSTRSLSRLSFIAYNTELLLFAITSRHMLSVLIFFLTAKFILVASTLLREDDNQLSFYYHCGFRVVMFDLRELGTIASCWQRNCNSVRSPGLNCLSKLKHRSVVGVSKVFNASHITDER